jgi:ROS/MUCR transcriptional regulator protein
MGPAMIRPAPLDADQLRLDVLLADPRRAVTEEAIVCLLCGGEFRQLTNTHLRAHGLTADQYKRRFGYNRRRALMCAALRRVYAERALRTDLAAHIGWRPIVQEPALRRLGGMRPTTLEERLTRADRRSLRRAGVVLVAVNGNGPRIA